MGGFNIEKSSPAWTLWADLFTLWKEFGNVVTDADIDTFMNKARQIDSKYKGTEVHDLALKMLLGMADVIDARTIERRKKDAETGGLPADW